MIGTILSNRYRLIAELGSGGMAWVYLAEDLRAHEYVAVKVLYPQHSQDLNFLQRFSQEARLAMSLSQCAPQRHIVCVLDYGSDRDVHYLVMEFVEGRDLHQILEEHGALSWEEALRIGRQVALALDHAYDYEVVHRDIKPGNIMVLPDGTVRVLDFGIARAKSSPHLTLSGFVGSPYYAAPEQAQGEVVDSRADIYSLGIVLYRMLSGNLPFRADTPWGIVSQHISTPPPSLREACSDLPGPVIDLVEKALAKRPEDRYQTPAEMVQAIDATLSAAGVPLEAPLSQPHMAIPALDKLYDRAQRAAGTGAWREAVGLYSQILKVDPHYRDVTEQVTLASRQVRLATLYRAARQALQFEHWQEAIAHLDEIAVLDPDYKDVAELRARAEAREDMDLQEPDSIAEGATLVGSREGLRAQGLAAERAAQGGPASPPARRVRRPWILALVVVLLAGLPLLTYALYRGQQPAAVTATATVAQVASPAAGTGTAMPGPSTVPVSGASPVAGPDTAGDTSTDAVTATPTITPALVDASTPVVAPTSDAAPAGPVLEGQIALPRFDSVRGTYDIYLCQLGGATGLAAGSADCRRIVAQASQPDLLPGGDQVVFHSWKPDDKGITVLSLADRRMWQITGVIEDARPSVDWDGDLYVYHTRHEADRQARIFRTYGVETRPIRREGRTVLGSAPSWTPNRRILYSGCLGDACGIIVMDAEGSGARQIVAGSTETNPEASPDGRQVAFMSQRDGNWEVYVVDIDGSNLRRLTDSPANDGLPTWSPGGDHIAFVTDREGSWAVWVMRPDGSDQRQLFALGGPLEGGVQGAAAHEIRGWVEERISWSPLP